MTKPGQIGGDLQSLMRQAQAMQSQLTQVQERMKTQTFVGEAGGGLVKVTVNGEFEVVGVVVDAEGVGDDLELTVDLIAAAVNTAIKTAKEALAEATRGITGGISLPGMP